MKFNEDFTELGKMPFNIGDQLVLEDTGLTIACRRPKEGEAGKYQPLTTAKTGDGIAIGDSGLELMGGMVAVPYPVMLKKVSETEIEVLKIP